MKDPGLSLYSLLNPLFKWALFYFFLFSFFLLILQIGHDLLVLLLVELVEAEASCGDDPQDSRNGAEGVVHNAQYFRILHGIAYVSCAAQSNGEERCAECHSYLVAQRDEGVLESVVSDARLPLAILHTVGDDGIDAVLKPEKKNHDKAENR